MTTHLYCVLPQEEHASLPPGLSGLAGAAVRALPVDGMVAWVSDIERGVPVSVDGVRAHDAVVEAALETGSTPVPARFGQRFDNDDACVAAIVSRAASVESLLDDLQGHVEMTLIVTPTTRRMINDLEPVMPEMAEMDTGMPGAGRAYLHSGKDGRLIRTFTCKIPGEAFGFDAVSMGDIDGSRAFLITSAWSGVSGFHSGRVFILSSGVAHSPQRR